MIIQLSEELQSACYIYASLQELGWGNVVDSLKMKARAALAYTHACYLSTPRAAAPNWSTRDDACPAVLSVAKHGLHSAVFSFNATF